MSLNQKILSLLSPRALPVIAAIGLSSALMGVTAQAAPHRGEGRGEGQSEELREAREEVAALALFHKLKVSPAQKGSLMPALEKARQARNQIEAQREAREQTMLKLLDEAGDEVRGTGEVSEGLKARLAEARQGDNSEMKAHREVLKASIEAAVAQLTPAQRQVLETFHGRDLLESDGEGKPQLIRQLERLRDMPGFKLEKRLKHLEEREGRGARSQKSDVEELRQLARDIRSMPEREWLAERGQLAADVDPELLKLLLRPTGEEREGRDGGQRRPQHQERIMGRLLSSDAFVDAVRALR